MWRSVLGWRQALRYLLTEVLARYKGHRSVQQLCVESTPGHGDGQGRPQPRYRWLVAASGSGRDGDEFIHKRSRAQVLGVWVSTLQV